MTRFYYWFMWRPGKRAELHASLMQAIKYSGETWLYE